MKLIYRLIILIVLFAGANITLSAQLTATAHATATATIENVIGAETSNDLNFGHFTTGLKPGSIEVGVGGVSKTVGGIKTLETDNKAQLATFKIYGSSYSYNITLPKKVVVAKDVTRNEVMSVGSFTLSSLSGSLPGVNVQTFAVGATLKTSAAQSLNSRSTTTPFAITVNFN